MGIDIIIYDSSNNSYTEVAVKNFNIEGLSNVIYDRWNGEWDGMSLDNKVMDAYAKYCDKYDYIWAHRDGLIVIPEGVEESVLPLLEENLDFIVVNTSCRDVNGIGNREYTDVRKLFKDQCMQMTVLGATIVKGNVIKAILNEIPLEKGKTYGLWQPMAFFYYFEKEKLKVKSLVDEIWMANSGSPDTSFWKKNTMLQWCGMWYDMVMNLPDIYDEVKKDVLKVEMSDFHPFTIKNLLGLRTVYGLNSHMVHRYKDRILFVCDTPVWIFYLISFIPQCIAKHLSYHLGNIIDKVGKGYHVVACDYIDEEVLLNG